MHPMSSKKGYTTPKKRIATLFTLALSLMTANTRFDWIQRTVDKTLISSLAISSPVILLVKNYKRTRRCCIFQSDMKRITIAKTSPRRVVPSKVTDKYLPFISSFNIFFSSASIKGTRSKRWLVSHNQKACSSRSGRKIFILLTGTPARKKVCAFHLSDVLNHCVPVVLQLYLSLLLPSDGISAYSQYASCSLHGLQLYSFLQTTLGMPCKIIYQQK